MPEAHFTFGESAAHAYDFVINRNVAGKKLSARLWWLNEQNQRNINDVLMQSVRIGRSLTETGKALLAIDPSIAKVQIPKYVRELADAARQARELSDSSILIKTV